MTTAVDTREEEAHAAAATLLGGRPDSFGVITGGRNSRVYHATRHGVTYAVKQYFRHPGDSRDRLGTEFAALEFMRDVGIRAVPTPIARSDAAGCAVYEFVEGSAIASASVGDGDIDQAVSFAVRLRRAAQSDGAAWLAPASEAQFSVAQVLENVERRLTALRGASREGATGAKFGAFLELQFEPAVAHIAAWAREHCDTSHELSHRERTLSPSDFGFHNAVRRPTGEIVFLDFEYFGWDDPAKIIADYLLHPAMSLTPAHKARFTRAALAGFDEGSLAARVGVLFPLFGLKWVTILLNEFLPEHLMRRAFAGTGGATAEALREAQLTKAERLLGEITATFEHFPYQ